MSDKVTNNSTDDRTLDATARPRIRLTREGNGGKAKDCRNEKQLFHGWLLINFIISTCQTHATPGIRERVNRNSQCGKSTPGRMDGRCEACG
jgi:hypothetical protein